MNEFVIRQAQPGDAGAIASLIAVLGYALDGDAVPGRLAAYTREGSQVLVAVRDAVVTGFLSFHAIPLFHAEGFLGRITAMAVDPRHQRRGIGTALVLAAEQHAREHGCTRMEVTSGDRRVKDAHVFYAGLGYAVDCRRFLKHLEGGAA